MKKQQTDIVVRNLNKKFGLNERFIRRLADKILNILKKRRVKLEVIFLNDAAIRRVNKRFKRRDCATDVLSFELGDLGEVIISTDTAIRNSRAFGTSFEKEVILYMIHGILHLYGYEDKTGAERARMSKKENTILENLCRKENFSKVLTPR